MILIRTVGKRTQVVSAQSTFLVFIQTLFNSSKRRRLRSYQAQWKSNLPTNGSSLTNCCICVTYRYQLTASEILNTHADATNTCIPSFIGKVMPVIWDRKKYKFLFSPGHLSSSLCWQLLGKNQLPHQGKTLSSELLTGRLVQSQDSALHKTEILNVQLAYKIRR